MLIDAGYVTKDKMRKVHAKFSKERKLCLISYIEKDKHKNAVFLSPKRPFIRKICLRSILALFCVKTLFGLQK